MKVSRVFILRTILAALQQTPHRFPDWSWRIRNGGTLAVYGQEFNFVGVDDEQHTIWMGLFPETHIKEGSSDI